MKSLISLSSLAFLASTSLALKPYQIRGVEDPIYHLYLQALPSSPSTAVMGPEASSEYFNISDTIQSTNTSMFLNIGVGGGGVSYLPLSFFNATSGAGPWGLEGDTIITTEGSSYGRQREREIGWVRDGFAKEGMEENIR
ncbi:hypothetical protein LAWI1_G002692 [Lachnellula willkommii]|uniref:Uncharacterized protein n=1 Tax=Lachnellula willkommii TaxID=215461 RepID=A0A559MEK4_9HELO|nr:hypothetical protein LAWI1_G002692 [Lachnellula willkommii]